MPEIIRSLEKRLIDTREKIKTRRREITGGVVEDKIKELGKRAYEEVDKDLEGLSLAVKERRAKTKEFRVKLFNEIEDDIIAARTKLRNKRYEITGGLGEEKAKEAAHIIKDKGDAALKEIEEDVHRISEKIRRAEQEG